MKEPKKKNGENNCGLLLSTQLEDNQSFTPFFVTFVSLPHDITHANAAYPAMSGINLSNIIINSMGPSHKDTLGFF